MISYVAAIRTLDSMMHQQHNYRSANVCLLVDLAHWHDRYKTLKLRNIDQLAHDHPYILVI
jgi:hypothetical protein